MDEQGIQRLGIWESSNPLLDMRLAQWRDLGGIVVAEHLRVALEQACNITSGLGGGGWKIDGRKLTFEVQWRDKSPDHFLLRLWMLYRILDPKGVIWDRCRKELKHYVWDLMSTEHIDESDGGEGLKKGRPQAGHYLAGGRMYVQVYLPVAEMEGMSVPKDQGSYLSLQGYGGAVADAVAAYIWRPIFQQFTTIVVRPGDYDSRAFAESQLRPNSLAALRPATRNVTNFGANISERTRRRTKPGVPVGDAARILLVAGVDENRVRQRWDNWRSALNKQYEDRGGSWRGVRKRPPSRPLEELALYLPPEIVQEVKDILAEHSRE